MAAELEADAGADTALPLIEQLRGFQPAEADVILAGLRLRQSRMDEATDALVAACVRLRDDPWPHLRFKQETLSLGAALGRGNPARARRVFDALRLPYAVHSIDETRLIALAELTREFDFPGHCAEAVGAFEPHPPWTADFLTLRRDCYQVSRDPRLVDAVRDVNTFASQQPLPLAPPVQ